jgi:hypothetical protein
MKGLRSLAIVFAFAPGPAAAQLAPGTYEVHAPLAAGPDTGATILWFVYRGEPLDLSAFPPDLDTVALGLEESPKPTGCFVFHEPAIDPPQVTVIFSAPREQSEGLTRIPVPSAEPGRFMLVRGDESGFTGKFSGDVPPGENLVVAHRTGPPKVSLCIDAVAELLNPS